MSENVESKDLSRTFSVANFKAAATPETVDEKRLKRWDSLRVVARSVSNLSDIGTRVVGSVRGSRAASSSSSSKAATVAVRAPKQSRSTLRGSTFGRQKGSAAAAAAAAAPAAANKNQVFGVELRELMERQGREAGDERVKRFEVPALANKLLEHLLVRGCYEEGILRIAASHDDTDRLKKQINTGASPDLYGTSIHVIGDLLKSFLRDLPGSLLDASKWDRWMAIAELESAKTRAEQCKNLILELDMYNRALITLLFGLFKEIVRSKKHTKMDAINLSKVFAPNVLQMSEDKYNAAIQMTSIPKAALIVETLISQYDIVFKELQQQYHVAETINLAKAASMRPASASAKTRAALRQAPAAPVPAPSANAAAAVSVVSSAFPVAPTAVPATEVTAMVPAVAALAGQQPALKKQKSETQQVLMQRFKKEAPSTMQRSKTELKMIATTAAPAVANSENTPNSPVVLTNL